MLSRVMVLRAERNRVLGPAAGCWLTQFLWTELYLSLDENVTRVRLHLTREGNCLVLGVTHKVSGPRGSCFFSPLLSSNRLPALLSVVPLFHHLLLFPYCEVKVIHSTLASTTSIPVSKKMATDPSQASDEANSAVVVDEAKPVTITDVVGIPELGHMIMEFIAEKAPDNLRILSLVSKCFYNATCYCNGLSPG